jgi:hypothetical protein
MGRWTVVSFFCLISFALASASASAAAPALRDQVSLNGNWPTGGTVPRYDSQNVAFDTKTYERQVTVPSNWNGKRIKLEFNAVNWYCDVYVNDAKVGSHTGAWVPFDFDITGKVSAGQTFTLRLEVKGMLQAPTQVNGKILWWIGYNDLNKARAGIVDDVWLRAYSQVHIEDTFVQTSVRNGTLKVDYTLRNDSSSSWTGHVNGSAVREASNQTEKTIQTADITIPAGQTKTVSVTTGWNNAALWWPDQPNLYLMKSTLSNSGDSETRRFGFKEFWIEGNQFRLNDIHINIRGDWSCFTQYWGSITNETTLRSHYNAMRSQTNANMLRWHKHPAPRFAYDLADEMGIMILNESALYGRPHYDHDQQVQLIDNVVSIVPAWIKAARNHASVMMWSACNEATYAGLAHIPADQLKRIGDAIYAVDPTRPVNYDGDRTVPGVMINRHYPEGYEKNPTGNPYSAWSNIYDGGRPTYFGEILAVRPGTNDNGWWIGVWPRGLRYIGFAGIAPRVYYTDNRITGAQKTLQGNAYNPIALFDKAYDQLGIAPYKDGTLPSLDEGANVTRAMVLYNDDYRTTSVTVEVELFVDGTSYAKGSKAFTLALGSKDEFDIAFQAPKEGGKTLNVVYRTYKNGAKRFEETKQFKLRDTGTSGGTSTTVTIDGGQPPANQPPNVNLTAPAGGATFIAPATVTVTASASDSDGSVSKVEFFANGTLIKTLVSAPYSLSWTNVAAGSYSLTAKATDNDGATKTSSAVNITVAASNKAPTVSIASPANNATFTAPADLTVTANASDSDGTVAQLDLYLNNQLVRTEFSAPYEWGASGQNDPAIKGLPAGSYTLRVVATDNDGASAQAQITLTVNNPAPSIAVTSLTLINADSNADIGALANGSTLNLALLPTRHLAVRANTSPASVGSVKITYDATSSTTQNGAPYSYPTDNGGNYASWTPSVGGHTFVAIPYSGSSGGGSAGQALTVNFSVIDQLPFAVEITQVASGKTYSTATAKVGALQYTDRTYTVTAISSALNGGVLIRQANDDKLRTGSAELKFTVNAAAIVYVCYDKRGNSLPAFLTDGSWTKTTDALSTTDTPASPMIVYRKNVPAGTVTLGGNRQAPADGSWTHYIPIVKPATATLALTRENEDILFAPMGPLAESGWTHDGDSDGDGLFDDYEIAAGLNPALADSDGNGVSDEDELASGTNLRHFQLQHGLNLPGGNGGGGAIPGDGESPALPFTVVKLAGAAKLKSSGHDSVMLKGILHDLPAGYDCSGRTLTVDIAGAKATFTLDAKGRAKSADGAVSFKLKRVRNRETRTISFAGGDAPFALKLRGAYASAWNAAGISAETDAKKAALNVHVALALDDTFYGADISTVLSAKAGTSAVFKSNAK